MCITLWRPVFFVVAFFCLNTAKMCRRIGDPKEAPRSRAHPGEACRPGTSHPRVAHKTGNRAPPPQEMEAHGNQTNKKSHSINSVMQSVG